MKVFRQLGEEEECFWNGNSFAMKFSGLQMNLKMILCRRLFEQAQRCFSNTCACVFNHNLDWICFLHDAFYFRKLPTVFVNSLDVFGICGNSAFEENMDEFIFEEMVNSASLNSPTR